MQRRQGQVLPRLRIPFVELQGPQQDLSGAARLPRLGEHQAEDVQRVGIARRSVPLHQPRRVPRLPRPGQGQGQLPLEERRRQTLALRVDHQAQRLLHPPAVEQHLGQVGVAESHSRPAPDRPPGEVLGLLQAAFLVRLRVVLEHPVEVDQVLGVILLAVGPRQIEAAGRTEVAQTLKCPALVLTDASGCGRPLRLRRQQGRKFGGGPGFRGMEIAHFGRVGGQVVEFGPRQRDVLQEAGALLVARLRPRLSHDAAQGRPTTLQVGAQHLEIGRIRPGARVRRPRPPETAARHPGNRRGVDARRLQHGRQHVDVLDRRVDPRGRQFLGPEDQRHGERGLVGEKAMRRLAVIPQSLAVIRRDDHQRVRAPVAGRHDLEKPAHVLVGGSDLAQVGIPGEAGRERRRRLVGNVGLVQVDPEEPGLALVPPPPGRGGRHHLVAAPLRDGEALGRTLRVGVVVDLEPPVQPVAGVQRERGDERRGAESSVAEGFGGRRHRFGQHEAGVIAHPVLVGQAARQKVRVRRQRHHAVRVRPAEDPAAAREAVEVGSLRGRVPREPDGVGPQGVDRHQDDIPNEPWCGRLRPAGLRRRRCRLTPGIGRAGRHDQADQRNGGRRRAGSQSDSRYSANCFASSAFSPSGSSSRNRRKSAAAAALLPPAMFERPRK